MMTRTGRKLVEVSSDDRIRNSLESAYCNAERHSERLLEEVGRRVSGFVRTDRPPAANVLGIGHRCGIRFRVGVMGSGEIAVFFPVMDRSDETPLGSGSEIKVFASDKVGPMAVNSLLRKIEAAMRDIADTRKKVCQAPATTGNAAPKDLHNSAAGPG